MKLFSILDIVAKPIPNAIAVEKVVEETTKTVDYTFIIGICAAAVFVIGLTVFFIKKNKEKNGEG